MESKTVYDNCGGTLISEQWVITTYHCVGGVPLDNHQIVLGGYVFPPPYQQNMPNTDEIVLGVEKIVLHPESGLLVYDIALVKMNTSVTYGPKIFPACVPGPDYKFRTGKLVTATGWGLIQSDPMYDPRVLQELDMMLSNRQYCERIIEVGCLAGNMLAATR